MCEMKRIIIDRCTNFNHCSLFCVQGNGARTGPGIDLGNVGPGLGGFDLSSLMSNPALMNMVRELLYMLMSLVTLTMTDYKVATCKVYFTSVFQGVSGLFPSGFTV